MYPTYEPVVIQESKWDGFSVLHLSRQVLGIPNVGWYMHVAYSDYWSGVKVGLVDPAHLTYGMDAMLMFFLGCAVPTLSQAPPPTIRR